MDAGDCTLSGRRLEYFPVGFPVERACGEGGLALTLEVTLQDCFKVFSGREER
jgi:hypothetical protein